MEPIQNKAEHPTVIHFEHCEINQVFFVLKYIFTTLND